MKLRIQFILNFPELLTLNFCRTLSMNIVPNHYSHTQKRLILKTFCNNTAQFFFKETFCGPNETSPDADMFQNTRALRRSKRIKRIPPLSFNDDRELNAEWSRRICGQRSHVSQAAEEWSFGWKGGWYSRVFQLWFLENKKWLLFLQNRKFSRDISYFFSTITFTLFMLRSFYNF